MAIDSLSAANAYRNQLKLLQGAGDAPSSPEEAAQSPFAQLVKNGISDAANVQAQSEAVQMQSLTGGKVDLSNLVTAVADAELSLNTVIAIRDRVINAYNDIIK